MSAVEESFPCDIVCHNKSCDRGVHQRLYLIGFPSDRREILHGDNSPGDRDRDSPYFTGKVGNYPTSISGKTTSPSKHYINLVATGMIPRARLSKESTGNLPKSRAAQQLTEQISFHRPIFDRSMANFGLYFRALSHLCVLVRSIRSLLMSQVRQI